MWTSDLTDCWLNTPDVRTADDQDDVGGPSTSTVNDLLDDFNVAADPSRQLFHHHDVTFQATTVNDPLSPATSIPLPVLQFYDTEASLEEQLVTPPVLKKIALQPDFDTSISVADLGSDRAGNMPLSSTLFSSPLSELRQEQFVLVQLPLNANNLIAMLSRITNNNEFVVDNSSSEIHHHHQQQQQQQQHQQQEPASENQLATSTAAEPCTGHQLRTSGGGETGNDVTKLSEEDLLWMLEDAASIVVLLDISTSELSFLTFKMRVSLFAPWMWFCYTVKIITSTEGL